MGRFSYSPPSNRALQDIGRLPVGEPAPEVAFLPVDVDPGAYAATLGEVIANQLEGDPAADLPVVVRAGIAHAASRLDLTPGRSPSSTVAILRTREGVADLYVLPATVVLVRHVPLPVVALPVGAPGSGHDQHRTPWTRGRAHQRHDASSGAVARRALVAAEATSACPIACWRVDVQRRLEAQILRERSSQ